MLTTLAELDRLITDILICGEHSKAVQLRSDFLAKVQQKVTAYEVCSLDTFIAEISGFQQREQLELYIEHVQICCTALADKVYTACYAFEDVRVEQKTAEQLLMIHELVLRICDSVLHYIETHYSRYFDVNRQLPAHYYARYKREIVKQYKTLKPKILGLKESSVLTHISLYPVEHFLHPLPNITVTYANLIYVRQYLQQLKKVEVYTEEPYFTGLERCLFEMNYNHRDFINYYIKRQRLLAAEKETALEQRCYWLGMKKALNQLLTEQHVAFFSEQEDVSALLNRLIDEELFYLAEQAVPSKEQFIKNESDVKPLFHVSMPVSQLAFLLRLMVDAGVIKTKNQTAFLKEVALLVATDRAGVISAESLRNKYYAPERTTMGAVKDLLFDLIKRTHGVGVN